MKVTRKSKWMLSILLCSFTITSVFTAASMPMEAPTEGEPVTEVQEDETDEGGNRTIKGIIYDEQGETIGASVLIKGEETTGTTSDMDGKFTECSPRIHPRYFLYRISSAGNKNKKKNSPSCHTERRQSATRRGSGGRIRNSQDKRFDGLRFRCVDQAIQEPAGKTGGKHPSRPDTRCGSYCDKRCARSRHESTCTRYYLYQ